MLPAGLNVLVILVAFFLTLPYPSYERDPSPAQEDREAACFTI